MRNHNRSKRLPILLSAAVIAVLAGCNNNSAKRPAAGTASNPAAAPEVAEAPRQKPAPPAVKSKPKVAKVEKPCPALDPGVNPLDVFAVVPGETKWQLASVDGKPVSDNAFTGVLPPKGVDSTRFQPLDTDKPSAGPSKRQTSAAKRTEPTTPPRKSPEKKRPSTSRRSASRPIIRPAVANRPNARRATAKRPIANWPNEKRTKPSRPNPPPLTRPSACRRDFVPSPRHSRQRSVGLRESVAKRMGPKWLSSPAEPLWSATTAGLPSRNRN